MTKSWKRLAAEELFAFSKTGATIAKECIETGVSELGTIARHDKRFKINTRISLVEQARRRSKR